MYQMLTKLGDVIGLSPDPAIRNVIALIVSIAAYAVFLLRDKK